MYQYIEVATADRVATIRLNRPEVMNAFHTDEYGEIKTAVEKLGADPDVGAIVITGNGKNFSAGGDIKRFKQLIDSKTYLIGKNIIYAGTMAKAIRECPKPVIAMINGAAAGAGFSCAMACDFRVVDAKSKLVMAFINMGLCGDTGSIYLLMKAAHPEQAYKMMMTGEPVRGPEAVEMGIATILAEEGKLEETTYAFAKKLAYRSTAAIAAQKKLINKYFYKMAEWWQDEADEMVALSKEPDFAEATYAFLEKRQPVYNKKAAD